MGCIFSSKSGASSSQDTKLQSNMLDEKEREEATENSKVERKSKHLHQNMVKEEYNKGSLLKYYTYGYSFIIYDIYVDIHEIYEIKKARVLGKGLNGSVVEGIHKKSGLKYAVKTLLKSKLKADAIEKFKSEVRIMALLDHPNIVRLVESYETKDEVFLVLELCTGGELLDRLHKVSHYSEKMACKLIHSIVSAVRYCHDNNIVHRDLKLENFLFMDNSPDAELVLIDFGLSQHFDREEILHAPVGSPYYVAPEVLQGSYDAKCDVWSIGVITYMLLTGSPPFNGPSMTKVLEAVVNAEITFDEKEFGKYSESAKDFIKTCLTREVSKRPTAAELQQHPWLHSIPDSHEELISPSIIENLKGFQSRKLLSKLCAEVVAHTLNPNQISELRKEFLKLDKDDSGEISFDELKQALLSQGQFNEEEIHKMFEGIDLERTGMIHYHEFIAATTNMSQVDEGSLRAAFDRLSGHRDVVTVDDIQDMLGADATDKELDEIVKDLRNRTSTDSMNFTEVSILLLDSYRLYIICHLYESTLLLVYMI